MTDDYWVWQEPAKSNFIQTMVDSANIMIKVYQLKPMLNALIRSEHERIQKTIDFVEGFAEDHCAEWRNKTSKKIGDDCSEEEEYVKIIIDALKQMR